ncbi:MAG: ectoine utilization protein EutC [Pseudomonadota bacterium]
MGDIKILNEVELRNLVKLDGEVVSCIENAFVALAAGNVEMPPILSMMIAESNGEVDVKTAYVPGIDSYAIKMASGFFDNPKIGLPSASGLMILFSVKTGIPEALLLDNGYLTDVRTAAAGAVAAKHLSRENSEIACIVGTGMQARLQLEALMLVRPIKKAVIWGRDNDKAEKLATDLAADYDIDACAEADLKKAVSQADIVVTTTPSSRPLIMADWLKAGQHITAMGSDQEHKCEVDPVCIANADLYVGDRMSQTEILGELRSVIEAGLLQQIKRREELGSIVAGNVTGRRSDNEITIADLTGTGIQDTAIATFVHKLALERGAGTLFKN